MPAPFSFSLKLLVGAKSFVSFFDPAPESYPSTIFSLVAQIQYLTSLLYLPSFFLPTFLHTSTL